MSVSYAVLVATLKECLAQAEHSETTTVGQFFEKLGASGYSFILIFLCLPFLQPLSLGPLSSIGGLALAGLGVQLMSGRSSPWIPERIQRIQLRPNMWRALLRVCEKVLWFCGRISRQRYSALLGGVWSDQIIGGFVVAAGLLMAIPFFGLPLNNTLPALVIIAICIAELEDDGLFVIIAAVLMLLTIFYFAAIFYLIVFAGMQLIPAS